MTIQNLIQKYENQLEQLQFTINLLRSELKNSNNKEKEKDIIKSVKHYKKIKSIKHYKKGKHWTQRPENKARLKKILKNAAKRKALLQRKGLIK